MSPHSSLQHFKRGILLTIQWARTEHKNMEKVFLTVLAGATDLAVIHAVHGVLDLIYYAHFGTHTDESGSSWSWVFLMQHGSLSTTTNTFSRILKYKNTSLSANFTISNTTSTWSDHMEPLTGSTQKVQNIYILILWKWDSRQPTRRKFIKQMTIWLCHQESIQWFYL